VKTCFLACGARGSESAVPVCAGRTRPFSLYAEDARVDITTQRT